ncbi:ring finger protein, putative [Ricinus communis]|uniref:RING-type E3 ubiquitin transferase n=2 Tax=Ricinus communis TaxID=3988 RepID=B9RZE9_RICCO|nr:ring finger protein, putative [Ricinus communis]
MAIAAFPPSPSPSPSSAPQWAPSPLAETSTATLNQSSSSLQQTAKLPVDFSPPLIAMVVVVATAFLLITYSRLISRYLLRLLRRWKRWRLRRRYLPSSNGGDDLESPPPLFDSPEGFHVYSPYGLDDSVIKALPLFLFTTTKNGKQSIIKDCAVCLLEFEENDYVRTLPVCSHAFHVDCIDIWLRSHANCPLCRARIFQTSPFVPVMAARIRPSLDDTIILPIESMIQTPPPTVTTTEIVEEAASPIRNSHNFYIQSEDRFSRRDFLLKRSYSFGFERSLAASERMLITEPATASPWRYRRGSFWGKRPSPFGSLSKPRVFSFRYYRGMKSPFFRRRGGGGGFFPLSERFPAGGGGGGGSSRRSKSMASPMFMRSSVAAFSSSRLRCGDPEALLSPERFNRR